MIQVTVLTQDETDPSHPIDVSPVSSGEKYPFLRDRTRGETEDFIRDMVGRGSWVAGEYKMYHDGDFLGTVNLMGPAYGYGDWVCLEEARGDENMVLDRPGNAGSPYYPNRGQVRRSFKRTQNADVWEYEVTFPGSMGVGTETVTLSEHEIFLVVAA